MRRVDPPLPVSLPKPAADLLTLAVGPDGEPLGTIAVLAHCPALLGPFLGWAAALALEGTLSHRDHEILALRAAFCSQSEFEWAEHVGYGRQAGLTGEEIAMLGFPPDAGGWSDLERALLQAADGLIDAHDIDDNTWQVLATHYSPAALVELVYVVGQYTMLSIVANGLRIPAAGGSDPLPPRPS
jgi:4-carboxymuconolactone decarboxylase